MTSVSQPPVIELCGFKVGLRTPLFLISGPCVIESRSFTQDIAGHLKELCQTLGINFIFKASYDKANRSSGASFRGPGRDEGLSILNDIRHTLKVPVLSDVHSVAEVADVAAAVDVLQIPAFLCRQTDLIEACAATGKPLNIKKGQFLSPREMNQVTSKAYQKNNRSVLVCERGFSFGYNNLVVDMRSLCLLRETGCPVIFDATHSVQLPGAQGQSSGGERRFIPVLARAAVATGIAGLFMETHPQPDQAKSDGPNAWPLSLMEPLLRQLRDLDQIIKQGPWHEEQVAD